MDPHAGKIVINGAASQQDRWLEALGAGYSDVDARSFGEVLEFPLRLGSLINFYNLADKIDGDWVAFFARDPSMVMVAIQVLKLAQTETAYLALERQTIEARNERKFELFCELFAEVTTLAREINAWLEALGPKPHSRTARLLREQIVAAINRELGPALRRLIGYAEGAGRPEALGRRVPLELAGFLPIWELRCDCPDSSIYQGGSRNRKIDHALPYVGTVFVMFLDAMSQLQPFARSNLDASLEEADHQPHIALYIAFARMFRTAQNSINSISDRYIHFYYHDILREDSRAAVPDHVYLTLTLGADQGATSTTIPRGTLFSAGQDSNDIDILYAADKGLLVTPASIAKVRNVRVLRGALLHGVQSGELAQRIFSTEIVIPAKPAAAGAPLSWSTFGETEVGHNPIEVTTLATLGFAIASPYLLLAGGRRVVTLQFYCSSVSAKKLASLLADIALTSKLACETIMHKVLDAAFTLSISTAEGWLTIDRYEILPPSRSEDGRGFALRFTLPSGAAPVAAYDPATQTANSAGTAANGAASDGANPDPTLPTLKVYLRQQPVVISAVQSLSTANTLDTTTYTVYPLSLLSVLEITGWTIRAEVSQLSDLQLANTDGQIDPSKPFLLLGAPPALGSFLEIRHSELFAKTIESLAITITWFNLPQNDDGFKGWYRDYVIGMDGKPQANHLFDNTKFQVGVCVINPTSWTFLDGAAPAQPATCANNCYPLFYTHNPDPGPNMPECVIANPADPLCTWIEFKLRTMPCPSTSAADSAVRLQLTAPPYAFGDSLYAQNVLNAVIKDLPDPKADERSLLSDAARWIGACLTNCAVETNNYQDCMTKCLQESMGQLVQSAVSCLLDGLVESRDVLGEVKILQWRTELLALAEGSSVAARTKSRRGWFSRFAHAPSDPSPARAENILIWIAKLQSSLPGSPPVLTGCLHRCTMLLETVQCIESCQQEASKSEVEYKRSITTCLTQCMTKLQTPLSVTVKDVKYPNPPWLPQAAGVALDYSACSAPESATSGRFFHLLPFDGYSEPSWPEDGGMPLLPHFAHSGYLYVGYNGLTPSQPLTLLFQMAAGSTAGWSERPPTVTWSCLDRDRWTPLQPFEILSDGTNGLQNSGILTLSLPGFQPQGSTVLDPDCQWLMAAVGKDASMFPRTSRIIPNALLATWQDNGSTAHLAAPLPPNTIKSSVHNLPAIASIAQPMESFGGRAPETGRSLQTWLGERLRHKDRGILAWDYERLVLEQFPTVWKVQALPARNWRGAAPGNVLVVVVPGADSIEVMDPTAPAASADLLGRIGASLESSISPFVTLQVANPRYVRITVIATVLFADQEDSGACIRRLDQELVQYLSPWPYDAARAAKGGDYASEDEISEFIQTRPYVDAIASLDFTYDPDPATFDWYFLTSAKQHDISAAEGPSGRQPQQRRGSLSSIGQHGT